MYSNNWAACTDWPPRMSSDGATISTRGQAELCELSVILNFAARVGCTVPQYSRAGRHMKISFRPAVYRLGPSPLLSADLEAARQAALPSSHRLLRLPGGRSRLPGLTKQLHRRLSRRRDRSEGH